MCVCVCARACGCVCIRPSVRDGMGWDGMGWEGMGLTTAPGRFLVKPVIALPSDPVCMQALVRASCGPSMLLRPPAMQSCADPFAPRCPSHTARTHGHEGTPCRCSQGTGSSWTRRRGRAKSRAQARRRKRFLHGCMCARRRPVVQSMCGQALAASPPCFVLVAGFPLTGSPKRLPACGCR